MTEKEQTGATGQSAVHNFSGCLCLQRAAAVIGKLSHPVRLMVLFHLLSGEKSVRELQEVTAAKPSNLEQHLSLLRRSGLVGSRRIGRRVIYALRSSKSIHTVETLARLA